MFTQHWETHPMSHNCTKETPLTTSEQTLVSAKKRSSEHSYMAHAGFQSMGLMEFAYLRAV